MWFFISFLTHWMEPNDVSQIFGSNSDDDSCGEDLEDHNIKQSISRSSGGDLEVNLVT